MKLYLAGPMTGYPEHNWPLFRQKAAELREAGYEVVDASTCNGTYKEALAKGYLECMKTDLQAMLTCDGVALLPGWESSKGACIEQGLASALGMPTRSVYSWLHPTHEELSL
jgi:nucleoside 2-deoxyribosyltransferase